MGSRMFPAAHRFCPALLNTAGLQVHVTILSNHIYSQRDLKIEIHRYKYDRRKIPEGNSNFKYQNMEMSVWEIGIERRCFLESEYDRWSMVKTAIDC